MKTIWKLIGTMSFWLGWPVLWFMLRPSTRTRIVIINSDNEFLVVKGWVGSGKWILPGGGVHTGEDTIAGAIREIREEVGLELEPRQFREFDEGRANEYGIIFAYKAYEVRLDKTPEIRRHRWELTDVEWMPIELRKDLSPLTSQILHNWSTQRGLLE